ncbi:heavy-metal-associated domain-containing protein [Mucilaginibacter sp. AW1-3]
MKKFILLIAFCAIAGASQAEFTKAELQVSGLTCSMCSLSTQKSLATLDFIADIKPDLNKNIFYVTFKPGKTVNLDALKQKVMAAGFSVNKLVAIFNFKNVAISNDFSYPFQGANYRFLNTGSKQLDGETRLLIIDKDFVPSGTFKKYSSQLKDATYATGVDDKKTRVYHVTLS